MPIFKPAQNEDDCFVDVDINQGSSSNMGKGYINAFSIGVRFINVTIPKNATILTSKVTFQSNYEQNGDTCNVTIEGELSANPATFSTYDDYVARQRTSSFIPWNSIEHWSNNTDYDSPSIVSIIQELVNQALWQSGSNLVLFFADNGSSQYAERDIKTYEASSTVCARLTVTWNEGSEFIYTSSGGLQSAGSATLLKSKSYLTNDGIQTGGVGSYSFISNGITTYSYVGSGRLQSGGIADLAVVKAFLATGGLEIIGEDIDEYYPCEIRKIPKRGYKLYLGWIRRIDTGQQNAERRGVKFLDELKWLNFPPQS